MIKYNFNKGIQFSKEVLEILRRKNANNELFNDVNFDVETFYDSLKQGYVLTAYTSKTAVCFWICSRNHFDDCVIVVTKYANKNEHFVRTVGKNMYAVKDFKKAKYFYNNNVLSAAKHIYDTLYNVFIKKEI